MEIIRTEQINIPKYLLNKPDTQINLFGKKTEDRDSLPYLCHLSKNLWNEANYIVRQEFFKTGKWIRYNTLAGTLKDSENFKSLGAQTAQQILRVLDRSWNSFFKAIKEGSKNPDKFLGRPRLPRYKKKDGEFILIFTNQQVDIKNGYIKFPEKLDLKVRTRLKDSIDLREVRIIPKRIGYMLEIVYQKNANSLKLPSKNIIGIDFGLRNIVTIANNLGIKPIVIKGGALKSINQYYNKRRGELQSIYAKIGLKTGRTLQKLTEKRNRKIKDLMHKISRFIVQWCTEHNIDTIVIGYNSNWKQEIDLGTKNNQNFVSIPFYQLKKMIIYKAEEVGIIVKEQEESHTSKCSFLDNEPIEHRDEYLGKRISRVLFKSAKGIIINADVNCALNIIRKAFPKAFKANGIEDVGLHPMIISFKNIC